MQRPGWYLLAYDIADPRRLQRIHRAARAEGLAIQRSVFLVYGTQDDLERLLDRLETLMNPDEDDLRAYPVDEPAALRMGGQCVIQGALLGDGLLPTGAPSPPSRNPERWNAGPTDLFTPRATPTRIAP